MNLHHSRYTQLDKTSIKHSNIKIRTSNSQPLNETIVLIPNYETHQMLMNCTDCEHKTLGPDQRSVDLTWITYSPGSVIVFFTYKPLEPNSTLKLYTDDAFFQIAIGRSNVIYYISAVCGWLYFLCWITSMYPQCVINFNKKSVVGLNFDYVVSDDLY